MELARKVSGEIHHAGKWTLVTALPSVFRYNTITRVWAGWDLLPRLGELPLYRWAPPETPAMSSCRRRGFIKPFLDTAFARVLPRSSGSH